MCCSVRPGGRFVWAAEEVLPPDGADHVWESPASVIHAMFPAGSSVHPPWSGRGSCHACMWVNLSRTQFQSCSMNHSTFFFSVKMWQKANQDNLFVLSQAPLYLFSSPLITSGGSPYTSSLCPMEGAASLERSSSCWHTLSLEVNSFKVCHLGVLYIVISELYCIWKSCDIWLMLI